MSRTLPRILIAGSQSGSGKTTLTIGLVAALRRRGLKVQTFKIGPDYLDPTWLAAASGRPCYNLDGWMSGRDYVQGLFSRVARDADVAVIEGAMGLFDGALATGSEGSSAEIARWLRAPVLLVVNAGGMGRSIAAVVAGFSGFEEGVTLGGVVANRCGSEKHRAVLGESLAFSNLPALVGAIPRAGLPALNSRHLGLETAEQGKNFSTDLLEEFAAAVEQHIDMEKVLDIACHASIIPVHSRNRAGDESPAGPTRIAIARDEVFHFYYQDLMDELERLGCTIDFFSPLHQSSLPGRVDAVYVGGGYPEEFAGELAANRRMLDSMRAFARSGRPVYAECGGLIYLSNAITTFEGKRYPMLGVLPCETRMLRSRKRLGYVEVNLRRPTLWGAEGASLRGHEFHYSEMIGDVFGQNEWTCTYDVKTRKDSCVRGEGFYQPRSRILASYIHLHLASRPAALVNFLNMCLRARSEEFHKREARR
jgi:cobyrinic acid a,c-diamide synthase